MTQYPCGIALTDFLKTDSSIISSQKISVAKRWVKRLIKEQIYKAWSSHSILSSSACISKL